MNKPHFWEIEKKSLKMSGIEMYSDTIILIMRLYDDRLYSIAEATETFAKKGTSTYKTLYHRLSSFMSGKLVPPDQKSEKGASRWYGRKFKSHLKDKDWYKGEILSVLPLLFRAIHRKSLAQMENQEKRRCRRLTKQRKFKRVKRIRFFRRGLIAVALMVCLSIGLATTGRAFLPDIYDVLRTKGVKEAFAYSQKTEYQQAWINYRSGN